jgi:hypothetical protein
MPELTRGSLEESLEMYLIHVSMGWETDGMHQELKELLEERQYTMDLERGFLDALYEAAEESEWIPPEYYVNDWISDACEFLRTGKGADDPR